MNRKMVSGWIDHERKQPDSKPALVTASGILSYGELARRSAAARTLFIQRGLQPGQHILLAVSDERQFLCLLSGASSAGLVVMVADSELPAAAAVEIVRRFEPDSIVLDQELADQWKLPGRTWPIVAEPTSQQGALLSRLLGRPRIATTSLFSQLDAVEATFAPVEVNPDDPALTFFTSGSTSLPKAVELSFAAIQAHLATLARQHGYCASSRLLNPLPMHHVDGLVQGPLVALFAGSASYRPLAFAAQNVPRFIDLIYSEAITHLVVVPTMLSLMLRLGSRQLDGFAGSEFRHIISTAGHLEETLWRDFEVRFSVRVCNTYGLTETVAGGIFSGPMDHSHKIGTLGKPVDCEVRIVTNDGLDATPGTIGELLLRGANMMRGYYRDASATEAMLRAGWLHTGDLAWRDDEGFVHFSGRSKSVIVSGGHNIQPEEVDDVLSRHPGVQAVATLGLPHPEWEYIVVSAVVLAQGTHSNEADLLAHCRQFLQPFKLPRRILFVGSLPYGPSGKVRMTALRELFSALPAASGQDGTIAEKVMSLARQVFRAHPGDLGPHSGPDNTLGWDSLAHVEFISALESQFDLPLNDGDIVAITSLGAAVETMGRVLARG